MSGELSEYELQRLERIKANESMMQSLGVAFAVSEHKQEVERGPKLKKRKVEIKGDGDYEYDPDDDEEDDEAV